MKKKGFKKLGRLVKVKALVLVVILGLVFILISVYFPLLFSVCYYWLDINDEIQFSGSRPDSSVVGDGGYISSNLPALDDGEKFYYPIQDSYFTSPYGYRKHPRKKDKYGKPLIKFHTGVDLAPPKGKEYFVYPARPGVVVRTKIYPNNKLPRSLDDKGTIANASEGTGQMVILKHDINGKDVYTVYMHLYRVKVREGGRVGMGMPVGIAGNTGSSTGVHLHFEIRMTQDGSTVDPMKFLECGGRKVKKGEVTGECFLYRD